jgi:hypothetical protein
MGTIPPSSTEVKEGVELYLHSAMDELKKAQGQLYLKFYFLS